MPNHPSHLDPQRFAHLSPVYLRLTAAEAPGAQGLQKCPFSGQWSEVPFTGETPLQNSFSCPVIMETPVYLGNTAQKDDQEKVPLLGLQTQLRGDCSHGESTAAGVSTLSSLFLHFSPGFRQGDVETRGPQVPLWVFAARKGRRGPCRD